MLNLFDLTRELIDIPSTTGDEAAITDRLRLELSRIGFETEEQQVAPARANLIATLPGERPRVFLSTHMDCVPPHVASSEDAEYIYGRGACDTKGIIAAQLCAAERLVAEGAGGFGFLFTVDEEVSSLGAKRANEHARARDCRFIVNGEPTENRLARGTKGSLRVRLRASGRAAHSAYPERGESAIERLLDALADVRAAEFPIDEFFGETTVNIGVIAGGVRSNVIAAEAHADLHFRLVTDASLVEKRLEEIVAGRVEIEHLSVARPVRLFAPAGFDTEVVRFTTDIPHLTNWGAPLLLGPGSILDAHTDGERIAKSQLVEAVDLYADLARRLLALADAESHGEEQAA